MAKTQDKSPKRPREDDAGTGPSPAKRARTDKGKPSNKGGAKDKHGGGGKGHGGKSYAGKGKGKDDKGKGEIKTKEEQRELQKHRKSLRTHADVMEQLKKLWEQLRVKEMDDKKRNAIVEKMELALKDNALLVVHKHDGARIIECYIKYADQRRKSVLIEELIKDLLPLIKSKYGKFVVYKILKHATQAQKQVVIKSVRGHVINLVKHKEGAQFIDTLFSDYCNEKARAALIQEFFGNEFALFGANNGEAKTLSALFQSVDADKQADILKAMTASLTPVLNKDTVVYSIVHRALLEYFLNAPSEKVADMIIHIRELLPEILHTKDGAQVAVLCVQKGTNKDRKLIIRAIKPVVDKVSVEEYGFLVLCAIFDNVDDTVLVGKSLLAPVAANIDEIVANKYGWKMMMYLLQDRANKSVMNPSLQKILGEGDGNPYSKKDRVVRRKELRAFVSEALAAACDAHIEEWVLDFFSCLFLGETLLHAGIPRSHMEALASLVGEQIELLQNLNTHRLLKRLVKEDEPEAGDAEPFAVLLANQLSEMSASAVANQGAAFVLVALLESPHEEAKTKTAAVLTKVKALKTLEKLAEKEHNAGSRILLKHLKSETA